jgi:hypothetical protein
LRVEKDIAKMTQESQEKSIKTQVAELLQLFGPPPVLSSEDIRSYREIMACFLEKFAPPDFMGQLLIKELTDSHWEVRRHSRHTTLLMQRRFRDRLEFQAQRHKNAAQGKEAPAQKPAAPNGEPATEPEDVLEGLVADVDAILLEPAAARDHLRALEVGLVCYEHLDKLLAAARTRRNDALDRIERYRAGLGHSLRQESDKISSDQIIEAQSTALDAQPEQVAAPPNRPSDEQQP